MCVILEFLYAVIQNKNRELLYSSFTSSYSSNEGRAFHLKEFTFIYGMRDLLVVCLCITYYTFLLMLSSSVLKSIENFSFLKIESSAFALVEYIICMVF